ncbi:MAG TPA: hypothetical protein VJ978_06995 [Nitriliruptoraceae bacterium]|nr:hypothetical protein [Nitriliruptoraceae bacterium]
MIEAEVVDGRVAADPAAVEEWARSLACVADTLEDQTRRWEKARTTLTDTEPDLATRASGIEDQIWQVRSEIREQAAQLLGFAQALAQLDTDQAEGPVSVDMAPTALDVKIATNRFARGLRVDLGQHDPGDLPLSSQDALRVEERETP